jgi:hypothetical protein
MKKNQIVIGVIAGLVIVFLVSSFVVEKRLQDVRIMLDEKISAQEVSVSEMALTFSQGGVSAEAVSIIPDCTSDQITEYDNLLSSLDKGLARQSLMELDVLFKQCGNIAAARRAVMSLQLVSEIEMLDLLVSERKALGKYENPNLDIAKWNDLAEKETQISESFSQLVSEQGKIITALMEDIPATSVTVENIRATAQKVRESLNAVTADAYDLRAELIN